MVSFEEIKKYTKHLTLLYVEDCDDVRLTLLETFGLLFKEVVAAVDGKEGLALYKKKFTSEGIHYDLVISDIQMPKMNGIDMSREIKEINSDQVIALLTAHNDTQYLLDAIDVGVDKFIIKSSSDATKFIKSIEDLAKKSIMKSELEYKKYLLAQKSKIIDKHVYMTVSDLDAKIVEISQAYLEFTGYKKEEIIGEEHSLLRAKDIDPSVLKKLWDTISNDKVYKGELKSHKASGEEYWIYVVITPLYDKFHKKIGYTTIKEDVTDKRKLETMSVTDSLTTLHNRRLYDHFIKRELRRSTYKKEQFALLMLDIDYFKEYNDYYGHTQGDKALIAVALEMKKFIGLEVDDFFRIGGEEFAAIIINRSDKYVADVADKLNQSIQRLKLLHEKSDISKYLTISIGVVNIDTRLYPVSHDELFNMADSNLYKAKNEGRNRVSMTSDALHIKNLTNIDNITKLPNRGALVNDISTIQEESMLILLHINQLGSLKDMFGFEVVKELILHKMNQLQNVLVNGEASLYSLNLQEFAILVTHKTLFDKYLALLKHSILLDDSDEHIYHSENGKHIVADFTAGVAYGVNNIFNHADVILQEAILAKKSYKIYKLNQTKRDLQESTMNRLRVYKEALHNDNIIPYFQPIVDMRDGSVKKYEALARIRTEDGEIIAPEYFLNSAKEDDTFEFFTRQMMQKVFNIYAEKGMNISINLTYENIESPSMLSYIENRLKKYGGEGITFELLETEDIKDYQVIEKFILMIKKYQCEVSIDDFGSGYSNFTNIIKLNLDYIKLDGSLTEKLTNNENVKHIVTALVSYAKNANIKTIAEYVSSKEISDVVKELGIDYSQGYYYGEPRSAQSYDLV